MNYYKKKLLSLDSEKRKRFIDVFYQIQDWLDEAAQADHDCGAGDGCKLCDKVHDHQENLVKLEDFILFYLAYVDRK